MVVLLKSEGQNRYIVSKFVFEKSFFKRTIRNSNAFTSNDFDLIIFAKFLLHFKSRDNDAYDLKTHGTFL